MRIRAETAEVFYPEEDPVVLSVRDVESLKRAAVASPRGRARICTHANLASPLHEMLIVLLRESYVRPHKHVGRSESFSILEGEADVVLFNEDGTVRDIIRMGPLGSPKSFYYRLSQPVYHAVVPRTELVVFHEVTDGPFRRELTVFADWSPPEGDSAAIAEFLRPFNEKAKLQS